jgi:hypothetical protein
MERQAVTSSNIKAVGHDPTRNVLEVEFSNGAVWQYDGVPRELADQLVKSDSVGRFFAQNVRNQFPAKRVETEAA